MIIASLVAAFGLALVHVLSQMLRILDGVPRSWFLSVAGGMSVTFVILRLLPALSEGQEQIANTVGEGVLAIINRHVYLGVALSLIVFYGLERLARSSQAQQREAGKGEATSRRVFVLHITTFAAMNALIGYLLLHQIEQGRGLQALVLFFVAMLLKFIVNDHALHNLHRDAYDRVGRWVLAAAVLLGWGVRYLVQLPGWVPVILQAILAGGVLLNVLKEELPTERQSRYWPFALGALAYAALLLTF